jgi:Fe-S cluster assembly ATP-binding protein
MNILEIKNLHVEAEGKQILKAINLKLELGKITALMGKNGSGKSTLANTIMGNPKYKITKGKIFFNKKDITNLPAEKRAKLGIFLSFQTPKEIEGIKIQNLIKVALNQIKKEKISLFQVRKLLEKKSKELEIDEKFLKRSINKGFSGGEKKKMEILQMLSLNPKLAILDETDSGLDIDSLNIISREINSFKNNKKSILIITHYKRILEKIKPDKVIIMEKGKIIQEGDFSLVEKIESKGYKFLENN